MLMTCKEPQEELKKHMLNLFDEKQENLAAVAIASFEHNLDIPESHKCCIALAACHLYPKFRKLSKRKGAKVNLGKAPVRFFASIRPSPQ